MKYVYIDPLDPHENKHPIRIPWMYKYISMQIYKYLNI